MSMERLTDNTDYCTSWSDCEMPEGKCVFLKNCYDRKIYNKLREYEDAEEQGLLIRLPCKVGDIVYQITRNFISTYRIRNFIHYNNGNIFFDWECINGIYVNVQGFRIDDVGKTVFLTREEAEAALERMV